MMGQIRCTPRTSTGSNALRYSLGRPTTWETSPSSAADYSSKGLIRTSSSSSSSSSLSSSSTPWVCSLATPTVGLVDAFLRLDKAERQRT